MSIEQITVEILDRRFTIGTPETERDTLHKAVELLNGKISAIQQSGRHMETEKVVIMAALNLTHDLLKNSAEQKPAEKEPADLLDNELSSRISTLLALCDSTLQRN